MSIRLEQPESEPATKGNPQGVLLKRWEVEYSKLISNENRRIPLETVKSAIRSAFEDGMFEQWRITLKCPLSGQRIKVPARYADCTHIECFDLETFLRMKTQKNLLVCPICQKEVEKPLTNLRIDKYIETVLSTMPDAVQVELLPDGSFTEVYEELVVVPNVIDDEEPYVQDSNTPSFDVKQEALDDEDEYITLSDGEDDVLEEISIVDMKPISLMPFNMDIKPKIISSSELEQIHSGEDQEIQDKHSCSTHDSVWDFGQDPTQVSVGATSAVSIDGEEDSESDDDTILSRQTKCSDLLESNKFFESLTVNQQAQQEKKPKKKKNRAKAYRERNKEKEKERSKNRRKFKRSQKGHNFGSALNQISSDILGSSSIEVTSFNISRNTPIHENPKPSVTRSNFFYPPRNVQAISARMRPFLSNENFNKLNE